MDAGDYAGILNREKSFGDDDVEKNCEQERGDGDEQRNGLVAQDEFQRAAIERDHIFENAFGGFVKAPLLVFWRVPQDARAHHRS